MYEVTKALASFYDGGCGYYEYEYNNASNILTGPYTNTTNNKNTQKKR